MWADRTLLSNHGLVLLALARRPDLRVRDVAELVGITERAAQAIVGDLVRAGYVERIREGRRNRYIVRGDRPMPHPTTGMHVVSDLLGALVPAPLAAPTRSPCEAVLLGCSDYRYQEPLRNLLAREGLLGRTELMLLPGGASALGGRDGGRILAGLDYAVRSMRPGRLLLAAHQGCAVPGAFIPHRRDPFAARHLVAERRRRSVDRVRRRLRLEPELWFIDRRGPRRVPMPAASEARAS